MDKKVELTSTNQNFQEDPPRQSVMHDEADVLLLNIDGFEGPLSVLLEMARNQKVDLLHISILQLVRQYLAFVERAKELRLELAADYLVMAAWLAYLKSRLLLPQDDSDIEEPSGEEMAAALQFQLRRLEAMQEAGDRLMERPRLGQTIFARGVHDNLSVRTHTTYDVGMFDLLNAYGSLHRRNAPADYKLATFNLMSGEQAVERMRKMLGELPRKGRESVWATLDSFLPDNARDMLHARSSLASLFVASLEMTKQGQTEIRQDGLFRPIYLRAKLDEEGHVAHG